MRVALLALALALPACNPAEQRCAQARDALVELFDVRLQDALKSADPAVAKDLERMGRAETERLRKRFVPLCRDLPAPAAACVERIPEFVALERDKQAALARCTDDRDGSCFRDAGAKVEAATKDCEQHIKPLVLAASGE